MELLQVPYLRSGTGSTPSEGGCILQVIDWIDRMRWTDEPPCVHPIFQTIAISVNDRLDNTARQQLLDLAPRLMGTASVDPVLPVRLSVFAARHVLPVVPRGLRAVPRAAISAAEDWCENRRVTDMRLLGHADAVAEETHRLRAPYPSKFAAVCAAHTAHVAFAASDGRWLDGRIRAMDAVSAACTAMGGVRREFELLVKLLDEHDRVTGRTGTPEPLDFSGVCAVMTPVGA